MGVEIGVLGPLTVRRGERTVAVGGRRQRALLARLAVAGGAVVPTDRLLTDLWPAPASRPLAALQETVSLLRRVLEPERAPRATARVLVSASPGYALRVGDAGTATLDAHRFAALLTGGADGARGAPTEHALQDALRCWRGPAYAEVAGEPWAAVEADRLETLRLLARERLAAVQLERGRPQDAVADLEAHVAEHPLREEGVRLLALARYRCGRVTEALDALRTLRRALHGELGLEPGPGIVETESAILRHDPVVAGAPAAPGPAVVVTPPAPVPAPGPVLGREEELAVLDAAASRVTAPGGKL